MRFSAFSAESPKIVRFSAKHIIFASLLKWINSSCFYDDVLVAKRTGKADSFLRILAIYRKIHTFVAEKSRKVRRVNVMDATYSNSMRVYAPAEATRLAPFTPPL